MNRRAIGWLLMLGAPGVSLSTLVTAAALFRHFSGRVPLGPAGAMACTTMFLSVLGSGYGAMLLVAEPKTQKIAVPLAMLAGLGVFLACVFVAKKNGLAALAFATPLRRINHFAAPFRSH